MHSHLRPASSHASVIDTHQFESDRAMQFIELTGKTLLDVVNEGEVDMRELHRAGVTGDSIMRINKFGEIELRSHAEWVLVGGLIGNFEDRLKAITKLDWI
ncbi:MAG: hypothetical protein AAGJ40_04290 [Planctomycetota bacterium]